MSKIFISLCLTLLAASLAGCARDDDNGLPPLPDTALKVPPPRGVIAESRTWREYPGRPHPMTSAAEVAINMSHPAQPGLGPMSPPPTTFENSCAPEPYLFMSDAGYEAVRVKDCRHDQLLYLPASETARIGRYLAECRRVCSGQPLDPAP